MQDKHRELLKSISLFADLDVAELSQLAAVCQVRAYANREVVVTQGEAAQALFAIRRGRLKVVACGPDGRDTALGIMSEGEVFGEVALIDGGPRSATVSAVESCDLLVIEREHFLALLDASPRISIKLLGVLAKRLRRLSQRSEDAAFLDVPSRLARSLLDLASRFGERRPKATDIVITLKLSQQELGDLIGATRESINKYLTEWAEKQFLRRDAGRVIITDIESIRRLARADDD